MKSGSLFGWVQFLTWPAPLTAFHETRFPPRVAKCVHSASGNACRLDVKWCCTEPHIDELIWSSAKGKIQGVSTQRPAMLGALIMKLPPSIETHNMSPTSHICGQICLDLPVSAWIFRIMDTKMWVPDFIELLKRALTRNVLTFSKKALFE